MVAAQQGNWYHAAHASEVSIAVRGAPLTTAAPLQPGLLGVSDAAIVTPCRRCFRRMYLLLICTWDLRMPFFLTLPGFTVVFD